jgi:hypothetical protein
MNLLALTVLDPLTYFLSKMPLWLNPIGLTIMVIIMVPNIIYAIKHKGEKGSYSNKTLTILEQIGRYGCMIMMIFLIPYWQIGLWKSNLIIYIYVFVNLILCLLYIFFWIALRKRSGKFKALTLSILPSAIFAFSAIIRGDIILLGFATIFAVSHITISYKNAAGSSEKSKENTL